MLCAWLALVATWTCSTGAQSIPQLVRNHRYQEAVAALREMEKRHPEDARVKRNLGIVLLEADDAPGAVLKLGEALEIRPGDAAILFHLGRAAERSGNLKQALKVYGAYLDHARRDAAAVRVRIHDLSLRSARADVRTAIRAEDSLKLDASTVNTIAVPDFHVPVGDTLRPLARGIAVIMSEDLGRIPSLTVVERAHLQVLLDELKLAAGTNAIDPATAPRLGKLLAARRFAQGSLVPAGREHLQLDALVVDASSGVSRPSGEPVAGALQEVVGLEKRLVFQVIDSLGVPITPEIRHAIGEPPTRSFPAFLAFSRGIDFEERGLPDSARVAYAEATRLDPHFQAARRRRDELMVSAADQARIDGEAVSRALATESSPSRLLATGTEIGLQSIPEVATFGLTPAAKLAASRLTIQIELPP
jgi:tetratricopeptide (TPR) repeat protein